MCLRALTQPLPRTNGCALPLYRLAREEGQCSYQGVIWVAALLVVFLLAGLCAGEAAWRYGLGAGLAVLVWLMLPKWRLGAVALLVAVGIAVAHREIRQGALAYDYLNGSRSARRAVLDRAEWRMLRATPAARLVAGNGVGTFLLEFDRARPPETSAAAGGDRVMDHARRQLTEVLFERGIVGAEIAVVAGLACVAAGGLALRRARDPLDAALGAGLAASAVALGVFACFSNGAVSFRAGMVFWVALGLLGALSAECGRPSALSTSPEEDALRDETRPRRSVGRGAAAAAAGAALVAAWVALAARPFWAEYCLREGQGEDKDRQRLFVTLANCDATLRQVKADARRERAGWGAKLRAAEEALRAATAACDEAARSSDAEKQAALAARKQAAAAALEKLRSTAEQRIAQFDAAAIEGRQAVQRAKADYEDSARRAERLLRRAAAWSLGDRVRLYAGIQLALSEPVRANPHLVAERLERLITLCGPAFHLDVQLAAAYAELERPADAHALYRRYAAKNPFAAKCASIEPEPIAPFYVPWLKLIDDEHRRKNPQAAAWAADFAAAASAGLAMRPDLYALRVLRGKMLYAVGPRDPQHQAMVAAGESLLVASTGFLWLPDHARLLLRARGILNAVGHEDAARDMLAASAMINEELSRTPATFGTRRAMLYFELADANTLWNRALALKAANQVFLEKADPTDPRVVEARFLASRIIHQLQPPEERAPAAVEGRPRPPDTQAPPQPKTKADASAITSPKGED